jgi:hypothetical protein
MPRKRKGGEQGRKGAGKRSPDPVSKDEVKDEAKDEASARAEKPAVSEPPQTPASDEQEYTELVLLVHAANMTEAELFKTELSAYGIPTFLEGEGAGVAGIPDVGAGVPVLVPEEYADQAAELIAELESAKPEGNALDEKEDIFEEEDKAEEVDELEEVEELEDEDLDDEEDEDLDEEDEDWEEEEDEDEDEEEEDDADEKEDDEEWEDDDEEDDDY